MNSVHAGSFLPSTTTWAGAACANMPQAPPARAGMGRPFPLRHQISARLCNSPALSSSSLCTTAILYPYSSHTLQSLVCNLFSGQPAGTPSTLPTLPTLPTSSVSHLWLPSCPRLSALDGEFHHGTSSDGLQKALWAPVSICVMRPSPAILLPLTTLVAECTTSGDGFTFRTPACHASVFALLSTCSRQIQADRDSEPLSLLPLPCPALPRLLCPRRTQASPQSPASAFFRSS